MSHNGKLLTQIMNDLKKPKKVRTPKNQWQTPGQVTDINSQHITMQGVGFDAIGVSPDGTRQYMKNGQDYYFPSKPVREYPLMQKGGSHIPKAQLGLGSFLQPISGKDVAKFFEMFSVPQKAVTKAITGKYQTPSEAMGITNKAGAFVTDVLLDPVNLASGAGAVKATGIYKNAYKINPWAFKPDAKAAYRMIGSKGYDDALKTGYLKASTKGSDIGKVHTTTHYQIGVPSDKRMYSGRYWSRGYDGPYMAEVPNATTNPRFSYGPGGKSVGSEAMTFPENNVPLSEANIYKQDWLRGYKKVNVPNKKQNGGEEKGWFSSIASDIKNLFGIEEPKKKGVVLTMPKEMYIKDSRKVSRTTGKPINPNVELLTGKYPSDRIYGIVKAAKRYGIDPYDALAIDLQETGWGKISDGPVGHYLLEENQIIPSKLDDGDVDDFDVYARAIATKMQYADKLGYKDPEMRFQTYNGLGKIYPETEQNYHGFKMKKIYGVPVPKEGIDMRKNPLYGKRVMDIRDNILKKNSELDRYVRHIKQIGGELTSSTYVKKPVVKNTSDQLKMEHLKQHAQRASKKEQPVLQPRSSTPDDVRQQFYNWRKAEKLLNKGLGYADVITDAMQAGNFIPHPIGQAVGKIGNMLGSGVDAFQAGMETRKGNYGNAAINAASVALPTFLGFNEFRRNSKYLKPGQPLYPFSPQANISSGTMNIPRVNYIEPFTKVKGMTDANLMTNRALLGALGAETMYDSFKKGGQHGGLDRWFAEKWVDVKTGKTCGRQEGEKRAYPACRPSRRVSSETPKTSSEMSSAEKAKFKRSKTSSQRINYNHERKQFGGMSSADSVRHQANKILKYEQLRGGPGGSPLPQYGDSKYMNMLMDDIYPQVKKILPNSSAMEAAEAMDFVFNAGWDKSSKKILKDPRAYALQEYYKQYDPSKLDPDGKWSGRKNPAYSFDQEYNTTIGKLSENDRRVLMNRGRDWYYKNINNPSPGVPNDDYYNTWYGRIWNTNDFQPFNPNNPNFKPKKK